MSTRKSHRTPLRRISQGSLAALSRSALYPDAPHGLGFLEPAMSELVDEVETLQANVENLKHLSDSLHAFNESFASWLYVLDMNSLTTDWPQAPSEASYKLAKRRAEEDARAALAAIQASRLASSTQPVPDQPQYVDKSMAGDTEDNTTLQTMQSTSDNTRPTTKKKVTKAKLTAKQKKERNLEIEKIISNLPLEFRGNDPNLRRNMESVIEAFIDSEGQGIKLLELVKPPDLSQARVNKCLIALVNRKIIKKSNSTGQVLYHWLGLS